MRRLEELSKDELHELINKNDEFKAQVYEWGYQAQMDMQEEQYKLMGADVFDYHDHYSSFYLTIPTRYGVRDELEVAHKLDRDYMTESTAKIYDKFNELADKWGELTEDDDELEEELRIAGDALAEAITNDLRCYEDVTDEQIDNELEQIAEGMSYASDWETDGTIVYQHITKEYK